eukprot:gb/GEZN01012067.1/.p1 GENE.gb/GEZN01012067.1/~~gb/GEZN01012067.1/.p1  ORF type:complete len:347 (+),score=62.62 gb/GEZN01012067.1/:25-1065(+)
MRSAPSLLRKASPAAPQLSALVNGRRHFSRSNTMMYKVCVVGAAGGIGQPLSMLMKLDPRVTALNCYDVAPFTPGVAADISHISKGPVKGFTGDQLGEALKGCDLVIVPAGVPRKPGMTRDDLFNMNATIVYNIALKFAENCKDASLCIISNPVNSTVPIACEVLKAKNCYNPKKLFGVTTLDVVRANTFVGEALKKDVNVTVVGGHAGTTILPLFSSVPGGDSLSTEVRDALTHRIMFGGDEVVQAKAGAGSATLSMAYAGWSFASQLMKALSGEKGIIACTYVDDPASATGFFSSPVTLGKGGVEKINKFTMNAFEQQKYEEMLPDLKKQVAKGKTWAQEKLKA